MKNFSYLFLLIIIFTACSKSKDSRNVDCDDMMITKFKSEVTCPYNASMSVYLAKGIYNGKLIYFTNVICIACNTTPPSEGYNCNNEKITIVDFDKSVTQIQRVEVCNR